MSLGRKPEASGAAVCFRRRKNGLQMLAFILGDTSVAEPTDLGMLPQNPEQRRGAATVKTAKKNELVRFDSHSFRLHRMVQRRGDTRLVIAISRVVAGYSSRSTAQERPVERCLSVLQRNSNRCISTDGKRDIAVQYPEFAAYFNIARRPEYEGEVNSVCSNLTTFRTDKPTQVENERA